MPEPHLFELDRIPWGEDTRFPGIAIRLLEGRATHPAISLAVVRVDPGTSIATHAHPVETETALVLAGEGVIYLNDQPHAFRAGVGVTIPPGTVHHVENTGEAPLEIIAIHTPATR